MLEDDKLHRASEETMKEDSCQPASPLSPLEGLPFWLICSLKLPQLYFNGSIHPILVSTGHLISHPAARPLWPEQLLLQFRENSAASLRDEGLEKSCSVYQSVCSLRATVISLFVVFLIVDGRQSLKQTRCFDGLTSIPYKHRLWEWGRGLLM